jgi:hypothetical protein
VIAHALEGIAAALPRLIFVVARDEIGAGMADGEFGKIPRFARASMSSSPRLTRVRLGRGFVLWRV